MPMTGGRDDSRWKRILTHYKMTSFWGSGLVVSSISVPDFTTVYGNTAKIAGTVDLTEPGE